MIPRCSSRNAPWFPAIPSYFSQYSPRFLAIPRDSPPFLAIFPDIPRHSPWFPAIPRVFPTIPRYSSTFPVIPRYSSRIPHYSPWFPDIPCDSPAFPTIPQRYSPFLLLVIALSKQRIKRSWLWPKTLNSTTIQTIQTNQNTKTNKKTVDSRPFNLRLCSHERNLIFDKSFRDNLRAFSILETLPNDSFKRIKSKTPFSILHSSSTIYSKLITQRTVNKN